MIRGSSVAEQLTVNNGSLLGKPLSDLFGITVKAKFVKSRHANTVGTSQVWGRRRD